MVSSQKLAAAVLGGKKRRLDAEKQGMAEGKDEKKEQKKENEEAVKREGEGKEERVSWPPLQGVVAH